MFSELIDIEMIVSHYLDICSCWFPSVALTACSGFSVLVNDIRHQPGSLDFVDSFKEPYI